MRGLVWILLLLLVLLHQDVWNWRSYEPLVLGFIPAGLAHHVGISLAAAAVGALAVRFCWPAGLDVADEAKPPGSGR